MIVDIWSDIVCPWCYIGKRRFERALAGFDHRDAVTIVHRSFQLNPHAERGTTRPRREVLKAKYRLSDDQVDTMDERMERLAAEEGLAYDLSGGVSANTLDAHRLVHLARARRVGDAMIERLYKAYFTERRSIFDEDSLLALAAEAGLAAAEAQRVLRDGEYADEVAADGHAAAALGATSVPFFMVGGRYGVSGAQSPKVFVETLNRAWTDTHTTDTLRG